MRLVKFAKKKKNVENWTAVLAETGDRLPKFQLYAVFLSPSNQTPMCCLDLGHDHFLSPTFDVIVHQ
jgi:hypothetical protein